MSSSAEDPTERRPESGDGDRSRGAARPSGSDRAASDRDTSTGPAPGRPKDEPATTRPTDTPIEVREPTPLTQQLGRVAIVVLAVLFGVFAVANAQPVDFSWVFGGTEVRPGPDGGETGGVPLIILLVAAMAVGLALGALIEWQFLRARRAKRARQDR